MNILEEVKKLCAITEEIKKAYPSVENVRHVINDVPYAELKAFAVSLNKSLHTDAQSNRAYIIHCPMIDNQMDSDIWLYSKVIKIKPAEIIEE